MAYFGMPSMPGEIEIAGYKSAPPLRSSLQFLSGEGGEAITKRLKGLMPKKNFNPWSWGEDQIASENLGSAIKGGTSALAGILGQNEADKQAEYQAAMHEDQLARDAYNARRKASFQSRALGSLAAI